MKIEMRNKLEELLKNGCQVHGCKREHEKASELYLSASCHENGGVDVRYNTEGVLILECHVCKKHIATIAVTARHRTRLERIEAEYLTPPERGSW
jgi:hypothetical protein